MRVEAEVANCAARIKKFFGQKKAAQRGKPYHPAERYRRPELWEKAAAFCIEAGADPKTYVEAAFVCCPASIPGSPFPQQLASKAGPRWYFEYLQGTGVGSYEDLIKELRARALRATINQAATRRPTQVLLDPALDVPAFIRVLLDPKPEILRDYGREAAQEIKGNQRLINTLIQMGYTEERIERITAL